MKIEGDYTSHERPKDKERERLILYKYMAKVDVRQSRVLSIGSSPGNLIREHSINLLEN
jgi:hypothetical protein